MSESERDALLHSIQNSLGSRLKTPGSTLIDAAGRHRAFLGSFEIPDDSDLAHILVGSHGSMLKVGIEGSAEEPGERFWVKALHRVDDRIFGEIRNELVTKGHGLNFGDVIEFGYGNILQIEADGAVESRN